MGVIDRLRALSQNATRPRSAAGQPASVLDRTETAAGPGRVGEQRGDFMMLPPLGQTFGSIARLQHPIGDFLVTHRPTTVTTEPLTHGFDADAMGLIVARARRRPRRPASRTQRDALVHRSRDVDAFESDEPPEDQTEVSLPPRAAPRRLAATVKPVLVSPPGQQSAGDPPNTPIAPAPSVATPLLPSRAEVGRAVRGAVERRPAGRAGEAPGVLVGTVLEPGDQLPMAAPQMPPSTLASAPDSVPVLRRRASRGRVNTPIEPEDPDDALVEQALAESIGVENAVAEHRMPDVGGVVAAPPLLGKARVRGSAPPEAVPAREGQSSLETGGFISETPPGPASAAAQPERSTQPADSISFPMDPMQRGVSRAAPLNEPVVQSDGVQAPVAQAPARSEASRPTLASRPSLVSAGTTGIQRRARDESGGRRDATSTGLRATVPGAGSRLAAPIERPASGGSRSIAVPEQVRQAVRDSVGTAPSHVTVHEGGRAEALTRSVNAEAFTRDGEIFLAADAPLDSKRGQQLLAHELTHVVQQKGGTERMPAEHTSEGQSLEAGARRAESLVESRREGPSQLHHRGSMLNAQAVPQMAAGEGVQRSARPVNQPAGSPTPIDSSPALSRGGPQPVNFLDENWRVEVGQRPDGTPTSSMSQSELALSSAPPPITKDEKSGRLRDLERQAHELYPLIRQRLRAELVRDKERRGRMSREWG